MAAKKKLARASMRLPRRIGLFAGIDADDVIGGAVEDAGEVPDTVWFQSATLKRAEGVTARVKLRAAWIDHIDKGGANTPAAWRSIRSQFPDARMWGPDRSLLQYDLARLLAQLERHRVRLEQSELLDVEQDGSVWQTTSFAGASETREALNDILRATAKLTERTCRDLIEYIWFLHRRGYREFIEAEYLVALGAEDSDLGPTLHCSKIGGRALASQAFAGLIDLGIQRHHEATGAPVEDISAEQAYAHLSEAERYAFVAYGVSAKTLELVPEEEQDEAFCEYMNDWAGYAINTVDSDEVFAAWDGKPGRKKASSKASSKAKGPKAAPQFVALSRYLKSVFSLEVSPSYLSTECSRVKKALGIK
jgi:hypothetical protein